MNKKNSKKVPLISPKNPQGFFIEKDAKKEQLDLQIVNASGEKIETTDKKIHNIFVCQIDKKKKMNILDFILIRRQQGFEEGEEINLIAIKIESNKIQNMFDKYKKDKVRFRLEGILFASSIKNESEKIFLPSTGLSDAKFGLINDKYIQTIGIIKLNETKNCSEIKKTSRWVNVNFQEQTDNKNTSHSSYNFITNKKEDLLNFTLKLVDTDNNAIKFVDLTFV